MVSFCSCCNYENKYLVSLCYQAMIRIGLFSVFSHTTQIFESEILQKIQMSLNERDLSHNMKLTSMGTIFCLDKTFFTHFDFNYVCIKCFLQLKHRKLLNFLLRMREFIRKKSVNKVCIWLLNCHPGTKFEIEGFWFVNKSFCYSIFNNFPNKIGSGGRKEPRTVLFLLWRTLKRQSNKIFLSAKAGRNISL